MTIAYSYDLRCRILDLCQTHTKVEVSKLLKVSRRTVHRYLRQFQESGDIQPKTGFQKGHSHKLANVTPLIRMVESNPTLTLKEMARELGVSKSTIHRKLQKLGITKKKNSGIYRTR